jgi:tetratricopeptide (TPR) repeat protein
MGKKLVSLSLLTVIASFAGGFLLANALNRNEMNLLRSENEKLKTASDASPETPNDFSLDDNELLDKIAEADKNPRNFDFQKNLGLALYKYAAMKQDTDILKESSRILSRAEDLRRNDLDVIVGLGNAHFDLGYFGKDNSELIRSREFYDRALSMRPNDVEVRTDLGLTYFLVDPPEDEKAITEFQKSLKTNPKHEKTLEFIIQSLLRVNRVADAENYLAWLRSTDPSGETLRPLAAKIEQAKGGQPK